MAVKLRLRRMGAKQNPFYRIVAADSRCKRDGNFIENLGTYNPSNGEVEAKEESIMKWLNDGAIPTDTVRNLLSKKGIMEKFHYQKNAKKESK